MENYISQDQYLRELTKCFKPLVKPLANHGTPTNLKDLCIKLNEAFNETKVDLGVVNHLMLTYKSNPEDWKAYVNFDEHVYTRNLVDSGNDKFNLIILCWNSEQQSLIHDHSDCNCFMKMLQGELIEERFEKESERYCCNTQKQNNNKLRLVARKSIKTNDLCYINDNIGLHQIVNPSKTIGAISLHLYCPAFKFCRVYNKTGKSKECEMKFHTKCGYPNNEN